MDEILETDIYKAQEEWIRERFGDEAAASANYGWAVTDDAVSTKVYGHGVLTSYDVDDFEFEPFK